MFVPPRSPRLAREFAEARRLRHEGVAVRRIAEELGVSVSSVSVWTRDIELTPEQRAANLARAGSVRGTAWSERYRELRRVYQREGRIRARRSEPLHIAGCMLYWAEGAKDRNQAALANGDPAMVEAFMLFLRSCFGLTSDDVTFNLNVYTGNGLTIDEIEQLWMKRLGLPKSCARKHTVNHFPTSSSGRRPNKLPHGVCTLKVKKSTRIVQHIYGAIQEYAGIDCPEWLDGPPRKPRRAEAS
jgi:hypothetical protein